MSRRKGLKQVKIFAGAMGGLSAKVLRVGWNEVVCRRLRGLGLMASARGPVRTNCGYVQKVGEKWTLLNVP